MPSIYFVTVALIIFNYCCTAKAYKDITFESFESNIMDLSPLDGTKIIFSQHDITFNNPSDVPIFKVCDAKLAKYLGMQNLQDISIIQMKENVTNFDTWIWNGVEIDSGGNTLVDVDTVLDEATPKSFVQTGKMNKALQLVEKQDIFENDLHIVVFFRNASEATHLANLVHNIKQDVAKSCWDVLVSDPPYEITRIPSIGITSRKVFGYNHIPILNMPPSDYSLNVFVNANIKELNMVLERNKK